MTTDTARKKSPGRPPRVRGLDAIDRLPPPLSADQLLKLVSAYLIGVVEVPKDRREAMNLLGQAHRLWGARSTGAVGQPSKRAAPNVELDTPET